jgi:HAD superfamily hydrolase (TIGR01509 family)
LENLKKNDIPVGIATSAPTQNVSFILDTLKIRNYFNQIVDDSMVAHSKPHPEIYLKSAELLQIKPENCVVFEDSLSGTKSAFNAGAKVVAITTTLPANKHEFAHLIVPDFRGITLDLLRKLF